MQAGKVGGEQHHRPAAAQGVGAAAGEQPRFGGPLAQVHQQAVHVGVGRVGGGHHGLRLVDDHGAAAAAEQFVQQAEGAGGFSRQGGAIIGAAQYSLKELPPGARAGEREAVGEVIEGNGAPFPGKGIGQGVPHPPVLRAGVVHHVEVEQEHVGDGCPEVELQGAEPVGGQGAASLVRDSHKCVVETSDPSPVLPAARAEPVGCGSGTAIAAARIRTHQELGRGCGISLARRDCT